MRARLTSVAACPGTWWLAISLAGCALGHQARPLDASHVGDAIDHDALEEACVPIREICDGRDNDCDGEIDNGNPGGGDACDTRLPGECERGHVYCVRALETCVPDGVPATEVCDGRDNDCDGMIDDGDPGGGAACASSSPGMCAPGQLHCVSGSTTCVSLRMPAAETCDGMDNDCDGAVDNGFACVQSSGASACSTSCGSTGTRSCTSACMFTACTPPGEACDLVDEDCDGRCDPPACRQLIYQLVHVMPTGADRIYSTSPVEGAGAGYVLEGGVYWTYVSTTAGLTPLYRCWESTSQRSFVGSSTCFGVATATPVLLLGYVAGGEACGALPLYQVVCGANGFVSTVSSGAFSSLVAAGCSGGPTGFYAWPGP